MSFEMENYSSNTFELGSVTCRILFRENSSDEIVIKQHLVHRQYDLSRIGRGAEFHEYLMRRQASGLRPLIVDAGANMGASPVYFATKFPGAHVVAIEPDLENFMLLSKNVDGLDVEAIRGAISSTTGRARIVDPRGGYWAYRTQPVSAEEDAVDSVPRVTINDIYASHSPRFFPFIVKIDIEGAEAELFSTNTEWVPMTPVIIIELHDWMLPGQANSRPFLQCISRYDRDFIYRGEDVFSIANDIPDLEAVRERDAK